MGVKLEENKYIKNKIKAKFNELEVYNPEFDKEIYSKFVQLIKENSQSIELDNGISDVEINNTIKIFREMLIHLTNLESEDYWNSIDDIKLEKKLNMADGDFKNVVNTLMDILLELGRDIRKEDIRKLTILNDKLLEMSEAIKANIEIDKTLANLGLDKDKLIKLQNGDEETIKEFQNNLIKQNINKTKRSKPRNKK